MRLTNNFDKVNYERLQNNLERLQFIITCTQCKLKRFNKYQWHQNDPANMWWQTAS